MQCKKNNIVGIDHLTREETDIPQEHRNKQFNKKIENIYNQFEHKLIKKQQQIITKRQRLLTDVMECSFKSLSEKPENLDNSTKAFNKSNQSKQIITTKGNKKLPGAI